MGVSGGDGGIWGAGGEWGSMGAMGRMGDWGYWGAYGGLWAMGVDGQWGSMGIYGGGWKAMRAAGPQRRMRRRRGSPVRSVLRMRRCEARSTHAQCGGGGHIREVRMRAFRDGAVGGRGRRRRACAVRRARGLPGCWRTPSAAGRGERRAERGEEGVVGGSRGHRGGGSRGRLGAGREGGPLGGGGRGPKWRRACPGASWEAQRLMGGCGPLWGFYGDSVGALWGFYGALWGLCGFLWGSVGLYGASMGLFRVCMGL